MDVYDINEVLDKAPLHDVARSLGMVLEQRGATLKTVCPFHQDSKPSLNLFPADAQGPAHFHCFACGAHGFAIDLVKQVQGTEFLPAVQWLAKTFGIQSKRQNVAGRATEKSLTEHALAFAQKAFNKHHDSVRFNAWCVERSFDPEFLYREGLRCITHSVLVSELDTMSHGVRLEVVDGLLSLGLLVRLRKHTNSSQLKLTLPDQFRDYFHDGRVLIPIRSGQGVTSKIEGYAGRSLEAVPAEGVAKYLLSPGLRKADQLFNAHQALPATTKELKAGQATTLYLVEGFLDALRFQFLGLHAVALMGTSLSDPQFEQLKQLAENLPTGQAEAEFDVVIMMDNDRAGLTGADRLVRRLLGWRGARLRWVGFDRNAVNSLGKDPDTCLQKQTSGASAKELLDKYTLPAVAVLLVAELECTDATELQGEGWTAMTFSRKERALFRVARSIRQLAGRQSLHQLEEWLDAHLKGHAGTWRQDLHDLLLDQGNARERFKASEVFLNGQAERLRQARVLAYHGARRGELPCDEEAWLTLDVSARLFDQLVTERLWQQRWESAGLYDAVHLPRKLSADAKVLDDPRLKVMPHPADLHLQQVLLNELLTQRHDQLTAAGKMFSEYVPAVRWYSSQQKVEVTGHEDELVALEGEVPALSFGYQVDMDVLEGRRPPSDQGMFRPYGQCWRAFMESLHKQSNAIGNRVHVLRLDAKRYYDSIQRYVVRDALLNPVKQALIGNGTDFFHTLLARPQTESPELVAEHLVDRLCDSLFTFSYPDPDSGETKFSQESIGIPQGPVISAYIGTIALFPVDLAARRLMRKHVRQESNQSIQPRLGYARYVDDIVLLSDSEELLSELRHALQAAASKLDITLLLKGDSIESGTPEEVMQQLNEGRGFAASLPAWEPPLVGDGEFGWGLGGDFPQTDRQCALRLLRHPGLMDNPSKIHEKIKEAILAPDLRPTDLGLCARWIWWEVATELTDRDATPMKIWERYWHLWRYVCGEHDWTSEFEARGYDWLYAVEGLDKLLAPNPWMENDQSQSQVPKNRATLFALANVVGTTNFFDKLPPHVVNHIHVRHRSRLVTMKARRLARPQEIPPASAPQESRQLTEIEWLCFAAEQLREPHANGHPINPLAERKPLGRRGAVAHQICNLLLPDQGQDTSEDLDKARDLALDMVIRNVQSTRLNDVIRHFGHLLTINGETDPITILPSLPLSAQDAFWGYSGLPEKYWLYRFSKGIPKDQASFFCVELAEEGTPISIQQTQELEHKKLNELLTRSTTSETVPWRTFDAGQIDRARRTHLAANLFKSLLALQQQSKSSDGTVAVPVVQHLFVSAEQNDRKKLHLLADPVPHDELGVSAWHGDSDGRLRVVNVPHTGADFWRVGWAVADALGLAEDMAGETGVRDETLGDTRTSVEHYVLRQQLRKLQGVYLSESQIWSKDQDGIPKTIKRALDLLLAFDSKASPAQQTKQLFEMEAETRAMALRLQQYGVGIRRQLHEIPLRVLNRLPLWALQDLRLCKQEPDLRPDLALMLALASAIDCKNAAPAEHAQGAAQALRASLALAASAVGLRGCVASLWGFSREKGARRMPDRLPIPAGWNSPDAIHHDPQPDYAAIRKWLNDGDWAALTVASPWHWMLALLGTLEGTCPQAFDLKPLQKIYSVLLAWQSDPAAVGEQAIWPYDGLPALAAESWIELLEALPAAVSQLDNLLGVQVVSATAPQYRRNPHTDEFTDALSEEWSLSKPQYTGIGASDRVAKVHSGARNLSAWSEVRRKGDNELLSVHTLDRKLGDWYGMATPAGEVDEKLDIPAAAATATAENTTFSRPAPEVQINPIAEYPEQNRKLDSAQKNSAENISRDSETSDSDSNNFDREFRKSQRSSWKRRGKAKSCAQMRVALFQWKIVDTYSHPLAEAGLAGLDLPRWVNDEIEEKCVGDFKELSEASKQGQEFKWKEQRIVQSWPEHRRRALLKKALEACTDLGVELLVLPEVSVRPDTVEWLRDKALANHKNLWVLAGTYRRFEPNDSDKHLMEPLTLLWHPSEAMAQKLGLDEVKTFEFSRGKKYRAVAAKEFFQPQWDPLKPLYSKERMLEEVLKNQGWANLDKKTPVDLKALFTALDEKSPAMQYCMELICSELFLMTSPANIRPLQNEVLALMERFPNTRPDKASEIVLEDFKALGELLDVAQLDRPRRSVLLVPAATSRTNDYWHAGQASVLASGTATVFCNAVLDKAFVGGSCFIGIDAVSQATRHAGQVGALTPYHGWHKGIYLGRASDALSTADQALVVVDLDPIHVVSGKPRPQLLAEPMSMVAYLPVVEVLDRAKNSQGLAQLLSETVDSNFRDRLNELMFYASQRTKNNPDKFFAALRKLFDRRNSPPLDVEDLENFSRFFSDDYAVRERLIAWQKDRHQQPAPLSYPLGLEPAWLDYLIADLTVGGELANVTVPSWTAEDTGHPGNMTPEL
ncbi:CHC2 zinc finger domain-containing protein [Pseudomonas sp. MIL19]|uniref:CHC2 zinc finger domain-containing protein n=1 Tax=Pseudomonas sp. MIL19 TaxID=2976979 RepID=UPI002363AF39|nr:CHC2 zinc finger domain-containing protein [Pseudomonas sp. MIL19]MDD2162569.1 CHC2 zinc finger domain-containing protein [Pseudomonas sp. MIL19]